MLLPTAMKLDFQQELTEQLDIHEVFGFDIGGFHVGIDEGTVVSWVIMAVVVILSVILTRNLKVTGTLSKRQLLLETVYEKATGFFKDIVGEKGERYIPWLMSIAIFIGLSNIIGLFGMKPPTKSMQVTLALAFTSIVLVEYAAYKDKGVKGRLKAFTKPLAIVTPINLLEIIIMELIKAVVPVVVPVALSLYFDIFDGLLQAYIFVFLTALYIKEAVE